jgi:hypothetical protein
MAAVGFALPIRAQSAIRTAEAWSLDAQYLQLASRGIGRGATPSLGVGVGRSARRGTLDWRAEAGWTRAVRREVTGQGITVGLSAGTRMPRLERMSLRPGVALLAGWAESQDSSSLYAWRGVTGTTYEGLTGVESSWGTRRGRTLGLGVSLGGEVRLTRSFGLTGSMRYWRFGGDAAAVRRDVTLLGVGAAVRPVSLVSSAQRWWRGARPRAHEQATREQSDDDADAIRASLPEAGR